MGRFLVNFPRVDFRTIFSEMSKKCFENFKNFKVWVWKIECWLARWFVCFLACWFDWFAGWLVGLSVGLVGWLVCWLDWLVGWLVGWSVS